MLIWSISVTDIYLDNAWYNAVHTSRSVKYTVDHKTEQILTHVDSAQLKYNLQQYNHFKNPMQVKI